MIRSGPASNRYQDIRNIVSFTAELLAYRLGNSNPTVSPTSTRDHGKTNFASGCSSVFMNHQALRQRVAGIQAIPPDQVADNAQSSSAKDRRENVFLFVPNLIGISEITLHAASILTSDTRLHPNHPRHNIPLFHAPPPPPLQLHLRNILPPRRPRRLLRSNPIPKH
jgi:hypothetical protein